MKFENIKVGETVLIRESVKYGWNTAEQFWIPCKVERITPTQFILENGKRFKKDGREIGDSWNEAKREGEETRFLSSVFIVTDQTEEMEKFKERIKTERGIRNDLANLKIVINSDLTVDQVNEVRETLDKLKELLSKQ